MSNLYSASEARAKLGGIAPASLQRLVDAGKIRKVVPPENKKRGFYNKEDVDKLAEAMQDFIELHALTPKADRTEFTQAQNESDIKATVQIAKQNLGDNAYGLDRRMPWFNTAPKGDYVLKHNGVVVGYFSMQAIKSESIKDVFDKKSGRSIQLEDMEPIVPGKPLEVHVSGIGVKKGISRSDAKRYGVDLLRGILTQFVELGRQGIEITKIWAKSSTVPGIKLSEDLKFKELGYINNEQIGFVLDIYGDTKQKPIIEKYRKKYLEALVEWKAQHNGNKKAPTKQRNRVSSV
ncbi:MAG: hypothetical protein ACRDIV_26755 [Ktedonobacteraceae bacterium]